VTNGRIIADFGIGRLGISRDEVAAWTRHLELLGREGDYFSDSTGTSSLRRSANPSANPLESAEAVCSPRSSASVQWPRRETLLYGSKLPARRPRGRVGRGTRGSSIRTISEVVDGMPMLEAAPGAVRRWGMAQSAPSILVNPSVLRWARETAGLSQEQTATRLKRPVELVASWERGDEAPSPSLLKELARLYKRPVAALLLPEPPESPPLPIDFRTMRGSVKKPLSSQSLLVLRHARRLQSLVEELEEDDEATRLTSAPRRYSVKEDPNRVAEEQRALLGIKLNSQVQWGDRYRAFREWRAAVENLGIFVYQFRMPVEEVRGFSLAEGGPLTIVLNRSDDVRARIFTLFHEYAHLLLGAGGICLPEAEALLPRVNDSREERFCNEFSGSLLVPEVALRHDSDARELARTPGVPDDARFTKLVERFQVNRQVLLLRLHAAGMLSAEQVQVKWGQWELQSSEWKERSQRGGGPAERRPQRCIREYGARFPALVLDAQADGRLTMAEALDYLSIRAGERDEVADLLAGAG